MQQKRSSSNSLDVISRKVINLSYKEFKFTDKKGNSHHLQFTDFQILIDKFFHEMFDKGFRLYTISNQKERFNLLKKEFEEFLRKQVKFRMCLKCQKDFLSLNKGHRRCFRCKNLDPEPLLFHDSWGDTFVW